MELLLKNMDTIYFVALCVLLGVEVIANVPAILHTPLMSGANAISGIVMVGAILVMLKTDPEDYLSLSMGGLAVMLGAINTSGGFIVTGRMLKMFAGRKSKKL